MIYMHVCIKALISYEEQNWYLLHKSQRAVLKILF